MTPSPSGFWPVWVSPPRRPVPSALVDAAPVVDHEVVPHVGVAPAEHVVLVGLAHPAGRVGGVRGRRRVVDDQLAHGRVGPLRGADGLVGAPAPRDTIGARAALGAAGRAAGAGTGRASGRARGAGEQVFAEPDRLHGRRRRAHAFGEEARRRPSPLRRRRRGEEPAPIEGVIAAFTHGDEASPTVVHPLPPGHGTRVVASANAIGQRVRSTLTSRPLAGSLPSLRTARGER